MTIFSKKSIPFGNWIRILKKGYVSRFRLAGAVGILSRFTPCIEPRTNSSSLPQLKYLKNTNHKGRCVSTWQEASVWCLIDCFFHYT